MPAVPQLDEASGFQGFRYDISVTQGWAAVPLVGGLWTLVERLQHPTSRRNLGSTVHWRAVTWPWYASSVSSDTKWIIGTVIGAVVAMTGVVVSVMAILIGGVNARIDDVNIRISGLETDVRSMDDRLRAVEIAFGKVDQRLETLERAILPAASPPAN